MEPRLFLLVALLGLGLLAVSSSAWSEEAPADPWGPLQTLVGTWSGAGEGFGSTSTVRHEWSFVIDDHFLRLRTRSASKAADGSEEVHEDVGYISYDTGSEGFVFRQFLSEGYVNTYDLQFAEDGSVLFASREAESAGGVRAQLRLRFSDEDHYEMFLDLAMPGQPFAECQHMRMVRGE